MLGWFGHIAPPIGEEVPVGVNGGVDVGGSIIDGEPRASGLIEPMSNEEPVAE